MMTLIALAISTAHGADHQAFVHGAESELSRVQELSLPEAPPVYFARIHGVLTDQVTAHASFGGLISSDARPRNWVVSELRLGEPSFDNTRFGGWQNGSAADNLPRDLTSWSVERQLWRSFDMAYKEGVEQYARKRAQFTPPEDYPGDYTMLEPIVEDLGVEPPMDLEAIEQLALATSAVLAEPVEGMWLERGDVVIDSTSGGHWILDTEGTRLRRPVAEVSMRAIMHARTDDGSVLADDLYVVGRSLDDLPATEEIERRLRERLVLLSEASKAPPWEDEYVGPVLFEEDAAADLFRWVLVRQLEGTPDEIPFESFFGDLSSGSSSDVRLGRRVLPQGWSVYDDPSEDLGFSGGFAYDLEGTPASRVELVNDGVVRNALMSRVPRPDLDGSNGHARGSLTEVARGRASILHVEPPGRDPARKIHKRALALAASYGHDHYVVVRHLQEPASRLFGDARGYLTDEQAQQLPPPLVAWRVYADGREEMYRGVEVSEVQRYALRDIAAVGAPVTMDYLASAYSFPAAEGAVQGLPTRITAPSVLVGELELFPAPPERQKPRLLGPPGSAATP